MDADIVIFAGTDLQISEIAREARALMSETGDKIFVGRNDMPSAVMASPAMEGVIIANLDKSGFRLIGQRYNETFGKSMTNDAAFT